MSAGVFKMLKPLYWYFDNVYPKKDIKKINKIIKKNIVSIEKQEAKATNIDGSQKKFLNTYLVKYKKLKIFNDIINKSYITNLNQFGFDINPIEHQNDLANYNIYNSETNDNYDWHIDTSQDPYQDIKLTLIINLSEKEYEGGDLILQTTNEFVAQEFREPGYAIMFPSYIRHKVTPVVKGVRKNIAFFLSGPYFK